MNAIVEAVDELVNAIVQVTGEERAAALAGLEARAEEARMDGDHRAAAAYEYAREAVNRYPSL